MHSDSKIKAHVHTHRYDGNHAKEETGIVAL